MLIRPVQSTDHAEWLRMRLNLWGGAAEEHTQDIATYFAIHSVASPVPHHPVRVGSHRVVLTPLQLSLPSLRETVSAQPTLPFRAKVCHLRGTKQRKTAEQRGCYDLR